MASLLARTVLSQHHTTDKYDAAAALYFASLLEGGGSVLKDYYTYEEYISRRGSFIGKLPEYSHLPDACFVVRNLHAGLIFDDEQQQLDVQEVREREIQREFDVLLPLPTTTNTSTVDNFKSCPPADGSREVDEDDDDQDFVTVAEDGRDVPTPGGSSPHSTPGSSPVVDPSLLQQLPNQGELNGPSDLSDLAAPSLPGLMSAQTLLANKPLKDQVRQNGFQDEKVASVNSPQNERHLHNIATVPTAQMVSTNQSAAKNTTNTTPNQTFIADPRVSAMAGYGVSVPVKAPKIPHNHEWNPIPTPKLSPPVVNTTALGRSSEPAQKKRKDSHGAAQVMMVPAVAKNPIEVTKTQPATPLPAPSTTDQTATLNPMTALTAAQRRIKDIITGRILPKSKQEATDAATEHHERLLAAYRNSQTQGTSRSRKSARQSLMNNNADPDFMPHYFFSANFTEEDGSVRCICGATVNDENIFAVGCDGCGVWQHGECVYPDLSEEQVGAMGEVLCTVCDPWRHREVLRRLRTGEAIGKQKGKGQAKSRGKGKVKAGDTIAAQGKPRGRPKK